MSDRKAAAKRAADDPSPELARLAGAVETSLDRVVAAAVDAIWEQVPAYRHSADRQLRRDVTAHVEAVGRAFLASLTGQRPVGRADLGITRAQAMRRVEQGISLPD